MQSNDQSVYVMINPVGCPCHWCRVGSDAWTNQDIISVSLSFGESDKSSHIDRDNTYSIPKIETPNSHTIINMFTTKWLSDIVYHLVTSDVLYMYGVINPVGCPCHWCRDGSDAWTNQDITPTSQSSDVTRWLLNLLKAFLTKCFVFGDYRRCQLDKKCIKYKQFWLLILTLNVNIFLLFNRNGESIKVDRRFICTKIDSKVRRTR